LTEDGYLDKSKILMKDLIRHGGNIGKPMKAAAERLRLEGRVPQEEEEIIPVVKEPPKKKVPLSPIPIPPPMERSFTPQVRVVNGKIVLDEESLTISTDEGRMGTGDYNVVIETGNHITYTSFTNRNSSEKWTPTETEAFYKALRTYGTDFSLIERIFPNRTRRQIRNKFKREEKENLRKVDEALRARLPIDINEYRILIGAAEVSKQARVKKKESIKEKSSDDLVSIQEKTIQSETNDSDGPTLEPIVNNSKVSNEPMREEEGREIVIIDEIIPEIDMY